MTRLTPSCISRTGSAIESDTSPIPIAPAITVTLARTASATRMSWGSPPNSPTQWPARMSRIPATGIPAVSAHPRKIRRRTPGMCRVAGTPCASALTVIGPSPGG